ncbi:MAG: histidinol-phosphate transaminase [Clostridia bacterium]|nr:histidinol-phosphate transaminase [Clostridia bacterium]
MSRYFSEKYSALTPYVPGEQPKEMQYIKLNTNESPFPPSPRACEMAARAAQSLQLYSDPTCARLTEAVARALRVEPSEVLLTNGSDEILNFAFMAFCDEKHPAVFADITYGFYEVFAELHRIPYRKIPLQEDFRIRIEDYFGLHSTIFLANPNAPTGIALSPSEIEQILVRNPDSIVVVDEAYVDFGAESCVPLIHKYDNLLVTQTFSKSRSLAGGRLGFGVASRALIADLNTIKYSTNPYNVNSMTLAAGLGTMEDAEYTARNCRAIIENREYAASALRRLGFEATDSKANFLFAKHPLLDGGALYRALKEEGILVRHFDQDPIRQYNRITVGTKEQMDVLLSVLQRILEEKA